MDEIVKKTEITKFENCRHIDQKKNIALNTILEISHFNYKQIKQIETYFTSTRSNNQRNTKLFGIYHCLV